MLASIYPALFMYVCLVLVVLLILAVKLEIILKQLIGQVRRACGAVVNPLTAGADIFGFLFFISTLSTTF